MSRTKIGFKHVWGCIYPVLLYIVTMMAGNSLVSWIVSVSGLGAYFPESAEVIVQGITYLIIILVLNGCFTRANNQYANKKNLHFGYLLMAILIVWLAGSGLNYIMGQLTFLNTDSAYTEIRDVYYGASFWIQILVLGFIVPIAEELMYRGVLYRRLRVVANPALSIIISSLIFGLLHFNLVQGIYGFLMGIVLGFIMEKKDNIIFTCAGHIALNIFTILSVKYGISSSLIANGANLIVIGVIAVVLAIGLLFLFVRRRSRYADIRV